jgi:hypothetical protein
MYSIHVVGDRMGGCDGDGARLSVRKKLGIDIAFAHSIVCFSIATVRLATTSCR